MTSLSTGQNIQTFCIEGAHRTGKDSLAMQLYIQSGHQAVVQVRGGVSAWAFGLLLGRPPLSLTAYLNGFFAAPDNWLVLLMPPVSADSYEAEFRKKHSNAAYRNRDLAKLMQEAYHEVIRLGHYRRMITATARDFSPEGIAAGVLEIAR